ncbi:MAG: 4Fe-4S binding protein [Ruminococcus flavefaciens]|nr:4Fe-4S binding protein [Ruminococcus flavefaciens]MCM1362111.1 4Fe-4S binding protein [Clostridiales bacterium]
MVKRKASVSIRECVACGCCIKVCPKNAIAILKGIYAEINHELCVGCGKCAKECPASVITLEVTEQ